MLIIKQVWTFSTAAFTGATVELGSENVSQSVVYFRCSTLATTQSFNFESAQASTGPWVTDASTAVAANVSTNFAMRITGPVGPFVRPRILTASSGDYLATFIGVV